MEPNTAVASPSGHLPELNYLVPLDELVGLAGDAVMRAPKNKTEIPIIETTTKTLLDATIPGDPYDNALNILQSFNSPVKVLQTNFSAPYV